MGKTLEKWQREDRERQATFRRGRLAYARQLNAIAKATRKLIDMANKQDTAYVPPGSHRQYVVYSAARLALSRIEREIMLARLNRGR